MATTETSTVGVVSNPDGREDPTPTTDDNRNNMTLSVGGRVNQTVRRLTTYPYTQQAT